MSDTPESLAAILAEMRELTESQGRKPRTNIPTISVRAWNGIINRIEAAVNREREENGAIIRACMENANTLAEERDRAVQYANAAPHPGSASWKEIQADARKVATLRDSLVEILDRTNREKARDYDAALNGGILEIHDIVNTALSQIKGE